MVGVKGSPEVRVGVSFIVRGVIWKNCGGDLIIRTYRLWGKSFVYVALIINPAGREID